MTTIDKLDEFAKAALTGILSGGDYDKIMDEASNPDVQYRIMEAAARRAYRIAEAMATEREHVIERRRAATRGAVKTMNNDEPARKANGYYSWTED